MAVREPVQAAYNEDLQAGSPGPSGTPAAAAAGTDLNGRDSVTRPDFTFRSRGRTRHLDPADFEVEQASVPAA